VVAALVAGNGPLADGDDRQLWGSATTVIRCVYGDLSDRSTRSHRSVNAPSRLELILSPSKVITGAPHATGITIVFALVVRDTVWLFAPPARVGATNCPQPKAALRRQPTECGIRKLADRPLVGTLRFKSELDAKPHES
jgi:hypothetical protein